MASKVTVDPGKLTQFSAKIVQKVGVPEEDAERTARMPVAAGRVTLGKSRSIVARVEKAAIASPLSDEAEVIRKAGIELVDIDAANEEEIIAKARDAEVVFTVRAAFTRRVFENLPKLQAVVRCGVGYDNIDVDAATDNNVLVVNIPDFCFEEVSNHAILLLIACAKKLVRMNHLLKTAGWGASRQIMQPMGSIWGQTLGIVGCGNIGRMTARKAKCFGLKVIGYDPYVDHHLAKESGITLKSLPEVMGESDYVSLHPCLNQETFHLIGEKELTLMKPSAYLINTARGSVVDEPALISALQDKRIAGAGLDVFEKDPIDPDNPLLKMDNIIATPHSASYCDASFKQLRISVGQEAVRVAQGRWPKNVVNKDVKPKINLVKED
jgi:D-3-phosphoglycerate dehydrogenase